MLFRFATLHVLTLFLKHVNAPLNMFYVIEICYVRYAILEAWTCEDKKEPPKYDIALFMQIM